MSKFSTKTIQKGIKKTPLKALIYGANGVGKSHFASNMPNAIFMDIERNVDHLDTSKQAIKSWDDAIDFVTFLIDEKHDFETLVVDTLDQLQHFAIPIACKNVNISSLNDGYGKGLNELTSLFERFRYLCSKLFYQKQMNLIFLCHEKIKHIQDLENGNRDQTVPSTHERVSPLFLDWCNLIGYAHRLVDPDSLIDLGFGKKQVTAKEKQNSKIGSRVLRVIDTPSILAKETFNLKNIDGNIPLSASGLLKQIDNFHNQKGEDK